MQEAKTFNYLGRGKMRSPAISTVIKMMESLSVEKQDKIVEHLSEYIQDLQDEQKWNCLLYTSPSPRDRTRSRMPSSA